MTYRRLIPAAIVVALLAACGNQVDAEVVGQVGISVDEQGAPVVVVAVCTDFIDTVDISLGREGLGEGDSNPEVGTWEAQEHVTDFATLNLANPGEAWKAHAPLALEPDKHYIVLAEQAEADVEATQVDFFGKDVAGLAPGKVYTSSGDPDSVKLVGHEAADFQSFACQE